jgi:hypothetical protein
MGNKLKQALEELRKELQQLVPTHPELHGLYEKTIHALDSGEHRLLVNPLREAEKTFEVRHPKVTALINNVLASLSALGI